jgi:hypothetical protein
MDGGHAAQAEGKAEHHEAEQQIGQRRRWFQQHRYDTSPAGPIPTNTRRGLHGHAGISIG